MKNTCKNCMHWAMVGKRLNTADNLVDIGVCKNANSLRFKTKTESSEHCEEYRKRG